VVDRLLEASVVGSFTKFGYDARAHNGGFPPIGDLSGRKVVVTGATSGIGFAIAEELARAGASITLVARDRARAERSVAEVAKVATDVELGFELCDLADLEAVAATGATLAQQSAPPDTIVHCAGGLSSNYHASSSGVELTVVTQLLAPYLLTKILLPQLRDGGPGRVVFISSGGMYTAKLELGDLDTPPEEYRGAQAYAKVKRAQVVLAREWAAREPRVIFSSMHPGWVDTPGLTHGLPGFAKLLRPALRSPEQGADTACFLVAGGGDDDSGGFFFDRRVRSTYRIPGTRESAADASGLIAWCDERTS
jgi:NAD(P)-dependent dehydrogenase (short-subunit alcohol dehydrogenase family)